jgi:hypothetical protein
MSATPELNDFSDLYADLQNRVREQTGVSATQTIAKRFLNTALQDMHIGFGEKFPWCERQATLITQPRYTTGTLTTFRGSAGAVGTGTAWNTDNDYGVKNMRAGGKIVIGGTPEVYGIGAVTSDFAGTLDSLYVGEDAADATYVYFEDEYALHEDFLRPLDLQNFDTRGEIRITDRKTFRERHPRNATTGKPRLATIQDKAPDGSTVPVRMVRFWQPPDQAYLIPYAFVTNKLAVSAVGAVQTGMVEDTDAPIVPLQYRHLLVVRALYWMYRDRKDDAREASANAEFTDLMLRVTGDAEIGAKRPRIVPAVGPYRANAKRPYSGGRARRYSADSRFDRLVD